MDIAGIRVDSAEDAIAAARRMWDRDYTLWSDDPTEITDRLGWLDAPERADEQAPTLRATANNAIAMGVREALLVGMGGSSLYPMVLSTLAVDPPVRLTVLDSTDPHAVLATEAATDWQRCMLIPASKSGSTIEMACHLDRFVAALTVAHGTDADSFVVPITDPGSALDNPAAGGFSTAIHGQPDVGGRFSALTPFGLLPATLLGIDPIAHVAPARDQLVASRSTDLSINTPAMLGGVLASAVRAGRDKLTIVLPDEMAIFGLWIEQLVAESTGKDGTGIIPVLDDDPEAILAADDRIVVALGEHPALDVLTQVPIVRLDWAGSSSIAAEVVRWEVATAVAAALLGVHPFNQPDVARAKEATSRMLATGADLPGHEDPATVLQDVHAGDYIALLGYVCPGSDDEAALHRAAERLRALHEVPVTVGIGPRYLHSTGQLHKGGPNSGTFLIVVGDDQVDASIPGRTYTFSQLKRAQAAGDLMALREAGRRAAHVSLDALD